MDLMDYFLLLIFASYVSASMVRPGAVGANNDAGGAASRYIVGGEPTYRGEFPHHVAVFLPDDEYLCGGTILDEKHVLTTAYCLYSNGIANASVYEVLAGVWRPNKEGPETQKLIVEDVIVHPKFDVNDFTAPDLAVLRLRDSFNFNEFVSAAPIPKTRDEERKVKQAGDCSFVGFGVTNQEEEKYPNKLRKIEGLFLPNFEKCNAAFKEGDDGVDDMSRTQMCTINPPKNSCVGDGGGALVCRKPNTGDQVVMGVSVFVSSPCRESGIAFYMRAYRFRSFIDKAITRMETRAASQ